MPARIPKQQPHKQETQMAKAMKPQGQVPAGEDQNRNSLRASRKRELLHMNQKLEADRSFTFT